MLLEHHDKDSCQLFRMGLRNTTTPTSNTPLIRANMSCGVATMSCGVATIFSSLSLLVGPLLCQPEPFGSCIIFRFFLLLSPRSTLSCLVATTFSSLRFHSNSLSSPHFNLLRVARHCYSWFSIFSFSCLNFSLSILCSSVTEALLALSSHFLS